MAMAKFIINKLEIQRFTELLFEMTKKELRVRYKYTMFGFIWIIVNPILQMLVIGFVFRMFMKEPIEYYYYYLFIGLVVWNYFSTAITKATPSIVWERNLIKKANFPRATIPMSIIFSNFILFLAALFVLVIPSIYNGIFFNIKPIYIIEGSMLLLVFTVGISLLTSALNVLFRDVNLFVQALLIVWFYATPIVYSANIIPKGVSWLWNLNPMTSIVLFIQHGYLNTNLPSTSLIVSNICFILLILMLGIFIFTFISRDFDDWI